MTAIIVMFSSLSYFLHPCLTEQASSQKPFSCFSFQLPLGIWFLTYYISLYCAIYRDLYLRSVKFIVLCYSYSLVLVAVNYTDYELLMGSPNIKL